MSQRGTVWQSWDPNLCTQPQCIVKTDPVPENIVCRGRASNTFCFWEVSSIVLSYKHLRRGLSAAPMHRYSVRSMGQSSLRATAYVRPSGVVGGCAECVPAAQNTGKRDANPVPTCKLIDIDTRTWITLHPAIVSIVFLKGQSPKILSSCLSHTHR